MTNRYWQHKTSGDVFAVQVEGEQVYEACGPLHYSEITGANLNPWNFNNEPEDAIWLTSNQDQFKVVESPYTGDEE